MLTVYQAAYEGKLFIVQQMVDKDDSLISSFDQVIHSRPLLPYANKENKAN